MLGLEDEGETLAAAAFEAAVKSGDLAAFLDALGDVECHWAWEKAFRAVAHVPAATHLRHAFVEAVMAGGDTLRSRVNNDRVLVDALSNLLPPYEPLDGSTALLFRGANRKERRYRCYGHSWTDDLSVARSHAAKDYHNCSGVVLESKATSHAIISALWQISDSFHEREFVVDRRLLNDIRIIEEVQGPVHSLAKQPTYSDQIITRNGMIALRRTE